MRPFDLSALATVASLAATALAGPAGYGICQAGCAGLATACYAAAGFTFVSLLLPRALRPHTSRADIHL